jgi:hypothetical protein
MNKFQKLIFLAAAIGFIILFIHDRYLQYQLNNPKNQPKSQLTSIPVSTVAKVVKTYTDTSGRHHEVISKNNTTITEAQTRLKGTVGILDTAAIALDIQAKKIDQVTKANFELKKENLTLKAERDSLKKKTIYHYQDGHLNLTETKLDSSLNITANYTFNSDLNWVDYSKRSWFLGSKRSFTDIYSDSPNITIKGVNRVTIEHPLSQFGVRLRLSSRYDFYNSTFNVGPGAEISINNFDIKGYYYYHFTPSIWRPVIGVDYNIIKF